jgi:hypothetical protein
MSRTVSFRKDSISDGVSGTIVREVAGLAFGEAVEAVAGCRSEGVFEVAMGRSQSLEGFVGEVQPRTLALAGQRDGAATLPPPARICAASEVKVPPCVKVSSTSK